MINYPKAYKLFIEWFRNNEEFCELDQDYFSKSLEILHLENDIMFNFDNSFFKKYIFFNRGSLFEFFDEQEIYLETEVRFNNEEYKDLRIVFCTNILNKGTFVNCTSDYFNRNESLNEAFNIAFKLLEEKI